MPKRVKLICTTSKLSCSLLSDSPALSPSAQPRLKRQQVAFAFVANEAGKQKTAFCSGTGFRFQGHGKAKLHAANFFDWLDVHIQRQLFGTKSGSVLRNRQDYASELR